jgi:hypothetical protein
LATAENNNCSTTLAAERGVNFKSTKASAAFRPLTISTTNRALRGAILTCLKIAFASAIYHSIFSISKK